MAKSVKKSTGSSASKSTTIQFKVEADFYEKLSSEAEEHGMAPNLWARELLGKKLDGTLEQKVDGLTAQLLALLDVVQNESRQQTEQLTALICTLQDDLVTATTGLLVAAGKLTESDAEAWVESALDAD